MTLTGISWIIELILLIASVYLPPLITGVSMIMGGLMLPKLTSGIFGVIIKL